MTNCPLNERNTPAWQVGEPEPLQVGRNYSTQPYSHHNKAVSLLLSVDES
jgi:hypothetical protein